MKKSQVVCGVALLSAAVAVSVAVIVATAPKRRAAGAAKGIARSGATAIDKGLYVSLATAITLAYENLSESDLSLALLVLGWGPACKTLTTDAGMLWSSENVGFVCVSSPSSALVAIRGTQSYSDYWTDANYSQTKIALDKGISVSGGVSSGFLHSAGQLLTQVRAWLALNPAASGSPRSVTVVAHSMGSGIAAILAPMLANEGVAIDRVCLLAPPKVGDSNFVASYRWSALGARTFAFKARDDPVPTVPPIIVPTAFGYNRFYSTVSMSNTVEFELPLDGIDSLTRHHSQSLLDKIYIDQWWK
jgi:hypothetical protein